MIMNRFGVSFLSKSRKSESLNEEVMINKETGEIVLKGTAGEILSYNKVSRFNDHITKVIGICHTMNLLGKMYEVEFDVLDLPEVIDESINLFDSYAVVTNNKKISRLLISLDIDTLSISAPDVSISEHQPDVSIDIILAVNNTTSSTYSISQTLPLNSINSFVFIPEYPAAAPGDDVDYSVKLASLIVDKSNDEPLGANIRIVLNSVICVVKEEI